MHSRKPTPPTPGTLMIMETGSRWPRSLDDFGRGVIIIIQQTGEQPWDFVGRALRRVGGLGRQGARFSLVVVAEGERSDAEAEVARRTLARHVGSMMAPGTEPTVVIVPRGSEPPRGRKVAAMDDSVHGSARALPRLVPRRRLGLATER